MLSSKARSGSSEMGQKGNQFIPSPKSSSIKTTKGAPSSPDSSKSIDRKQSTKALVLPEKRIDRISDMKQQLGQLQEELKKAKEDRAKALKELEEVKKRTTSQNSHNSSPADDKIKSLELEVEKAKESEGKMLESMISQTKQLEQTKILFEEAKLEIRTLQETIESLGRSSSQNNQDLDKCAEKSGSSDVVHAEKEIAVLRNELRLAMQAEEKAKKALDDLAIVLKEVTMEVNQAKLKLSVAQSELENARAEDERSKALLKSMEDKLQVAMEESERLKSEMQELLASWSAKEDGFIDCMKVSEEVITKTTQENDKLIDSQRVAREENSKLRDILKQAVNEATVVKEALEIARNENSLLKDTLTEKENALQSLRQQYESLKVSEAASVDSLNELKGMLAGSSSMDLSKNGISSENGLFRQSKAIANEARGNKKIMNPSDHLRGGNLRIQNGHRHSLGESGKFKGSMFDTMASPEQERDCMFASVSNISDWRVPSSIVTHDRETLASVDFDHIDQSHLERMYCDTKHKKKKTMLRRFGGMFTRRSFHK